MNRNYEGLPLQTGAGAHMGTGGEGALPPVRRPVLSLDSRLSLIADLVGRCGCVADIGCDHGRLGAFLLQTGRCDRVQLLDISEPSLAKARRLVALLGLGDRVDFGVGDGASAMAGSAEVVVIAGMGGTTIAGIVEAGREKLGGARLILQPNVAAPELRTALSRCGYRIVNERIAPDGRRNYVIIVAEPGESAYDLRQTLVGPVLLDRLPPELAPYAAFRLRVARKALKGAEAAGDDIQAAPLRKEIEIWEEVSACLRPSDRSWNC